MTMAATLAACGGGGSSTPSSPSSSGSSSTGSAPPAATITITASGVSPSTVTVAAGSRVAFLNSGTRAVAMSSDPHPTHTDCPNIDATGLVQAGATGITGVLSVVRTCRYHDHNDPGNTSLQGSIVIQ